MKKKTKIFLSICAGIIAVAPLPQAYSFWKKRIALLKALLFGKQSISSGSAKLDEDGNEVGMF